MMLIARVLLVLIVGLVASLDVAHAQKTNYLWLGIDVISVTESLVSEHKLPIDFGAFVAEVKPESPVGAEFQPGDVITSINMKTVRSKEEFETEIANLKPGEKIQLGRVRVGAAAKKIEVTFMPSAATPVLAVGKDAPLLMLDTGGHMALIKSLTFTRDGNQIVSAGDDKVVRVWDRWTGQTIRTIRGDADVGSEGKIYAMALSPDGKWLAVGGTITLRGEPGMHIRLYDFASGQVKALLKGHRDKVDDLAFSADSKLLISGSHDTTAIIWDVASAKSLHQLMGHTRHVYGVGFTPDGARAVTASFDTTLRLWRVADGGLIAEMKGHKDMVRSLAISPADGRIASGSADGEIRLWDGVTGKAIVRRAKMAALANQGRWVAVLRFSPDGKKLLSGTGDNMQPNHDCHVWDVATGKELVTYRHHDGIVIAADISPDGRFAATGGGQKHVIQIWALKTGERVKGPNGQNLNLAGTGSPGWAAGFSTDGARIAWGSSYRFVSPNERGPFEYQLRLPGNGRMLGRPEKLAGAVGDINRAQAVHKDWSLTHRPGGAFGDKDAVLDVLRDGRVLASIERGADDGYSHRSYTFSPDGETIVSGGNNGYLIAYDLAGRTVGNFIGHEGEVWAVTPSPDGRLLVSG